MIKINICVRERGDPSVGQAGGLEFRWKKE